MKNVFVFIMLCFFCFVALINVRAQVLGHVPAIIRKESKRVDSTTFILNTISNRYDSLSVRKYVQTVQIIDANNPWPPRWYHATKYYTDKQLVEETKKELEHIDLILDAKVEANALSFFKLEAFLKKIGLKDSIISKTQGYFMLNQKMEPIDTVVSPTEHELYWHDFRINKKGERLISIKNTVPLDLHKLTDHPEDTAVFCDVDVVQILDEKNRLIYSWKATEKLDPNIFQLQESIKTRPFAKKQKNIEIINWSHLTGVVWDYDDNFLYSFRFIGIGKVSRKDGRVIWHIDYKDLPQIINGDTMQWYFQHDLNLLFHNDTSAFYSLYSLGNRPNSVAQGVMFEIDKRTNKVKSFRNFLPAKKYYADGQGSFDIDEIGNYTFSYGIYEYENKDEEFVDEIEYGKRDSVWGIFQIAKNNMCYKVHQLKNWTLPPRPKIVYIGDSLEASGDFSRWAWYELSGSKNEQAVYLTNSKKIKPVPGHSYCVEAPYGMGYSVSLIYSVPAQRPNLYYLVIAAFSIALILILLGLKIRKG